MPSIYSKIILIIIAVCFFATLGHSKEFDKVVVIVAKEVITKNEIDFIFKQLEQDSNRKIIVKEKADYLKDLIYELLLFADSEQKGIVVSESELNEDIEKFKKSKNLDSQRFEKSLIQQGINLEYFKNQFKRQKTSNIVIRNYIYNRVKVSDVELKIFYQQKYHQQETYYSVRNLLVKDVSLAAFNKLNNFREEALLKNNFEELILKYSEDPAVQENKGVVPKFKLQDVITEFAVAVLKLKATEISPPIKTALGYHLIQLIGVDRQTEVDFELVRDKLYKDLFEQKYNARLSRYIQDLKSKYQVIFKDKKIQQLLAQNGYSFL